MLGDSSAVRSPFCYFYCVSPHSVRVVVVVVVVKYCIFHPGILQCDDNSKAALALQKTGLVDKLLNLPHSEPVYFSLPRLVFLLSCFILNYHLLIGLPRGFIP
jgi:hypothetical protein